MKEIHFIFWSKKWAECSKVQQHYRKKRSKMGYKLQFFKKFSMAFVAQTVLRKDVIEQV